MVPSTITCRRSRDGHAVPVLSGWWWWDPIIPHTRERAAQAFLTASERLVPLTTTLAWRRFHHTRSSPYGTCSSYASRARRALLRVPLLVATHWAASALRPASPTSAACRRRRRCHSRRRARLRVRAVRRACLLPAASRRAPRRARSGASAWLAWHMRSTSAAVVHERWADLALADARRCAEVAQSGRAASARCRALECLLARAARCDDDLDAASAPRRALVGSDMPCSFSSAAAGRASTPSSSSGEQLVHRQQRWIRSR